MSNDYESVHPPLRPSDSAVDTALRFYGYPIPARPAIVVLRRQEEPGRWNDLIGAYGGGVSFWAVGTGDPGLQPMRGTGKVPVNPGGVARIKPGFYPLCMYPGYHKYDRKHPAYRQDPTVPLPIQRYNTAGAFWRDAGTAVGPFNMHRASYNGDTPIVGDYSHGCIVVRERYAHWGLLLALGYPEHGPVGDNADRVDLYIIDWSQYLRLQQCEA